MRNFLLLFTLALCTGCAGREINPDAAASQLAAPSHCPWSMAPATSPQDERDCLLEPQRAYPRQDGSGTTAPNLSARPLKGLQR